MVHICGGGWQARLQVRSRTDLLVTDVHVGLKHALDEDLDVMSRS